MKRFKKVFMALAFIFAGVLAFSLASNTKVHAEGTTVTYTVASTSSVTVGGTAPTGASATYSSTYTSKCQLTAGNSMTLTLSGFEGNKITGISLSMKSNKSSGKGSLSVVAGSTTIAAIEESNFNGGWYTTWSTSYVDVAVTLSKDNYEIQKDENVVFTIAGTANSLYCQSFTITYESTAEETPTDKFKGLDLQEQLAFSYQYDNQYETVATPAEGNLYYLGSADEGLYAGTKVSSSTLEVSRGVSNAASYSIVLDEGNYLIIVNGKYLTLSGGKDLASTSVDGATVDDSFRWSFDASTGRFINVQTTSRYLGINDAKTGIKAYATSGSYTPVALVSTSGEVLFKDAANNADRVTMRIGYTISKTLYESLEALGTTVTFGVRLNDTTNVECTKVAVDENTYRLFVAVNNIPLDKIDTVITACGYVSVDGTDTYTKEVNTYSVKTLAQEYLTNHADDEAVVTAKYALVYLAYYA